MDARPLTSQQQNVLTFVEDFLRGHGFPPTMREIGDAIGLANINAVRGHLAALEKKGYITRAPDKARSIQVVHSPSAISRVKRKLHEVFHTDEGVFHRIVYGLAWATRRRAPLFTGPRREWMSEAIDREAIEHGWRILDKRIEPDHIVVVVETWPNHSPERTAHRFQAAGKALRRRHPGEFPGEPLWEKGYAVTTDLELLDDLVVKLLAGQMREKEDEKRAP
jgi:REP element-mobilizing transposase RayT